MTPMKLIALFIGIGIFGILAVTIAAGQPTLGLGPGAQLRFAVFTLGVGLALAAAVLEFIWLERG